MNGTENLTGRQPSSGEPGDGQDPAGLSRREVLGAAGAGAAAVMVPRWLTGPAQAATGTRDGLAGAPAVRAAMHVHASWSEGEASWDAQFHQATANAMDVLYMTDHDHRARALGFATSLKGLPWDITNSGTFAQKTAAASGGSVRLLAESASATAAATLTMQVQERPTARNRLHTSIAGTALTQRITSAALTRGATYELVMPLSYHPAVAGRPAGQYQLVYRFGGRVGRWREGNELTGVVGAPAPAAGSVRVLTPVEDVAAIWPDLVAMDNSFYGLSLVARSPRRGAVADVQVDSITIARTRTSIPDVIANQAAIVAAYQSRYPAVTAHPEIEIGSHLPHINPFGMPQWLPDYSQFPTDHDTLNRQLVAKIHALGGIASYNHPFGTNDGPLLSGAEQVAARREVFASMNAVHVFGADILEVGYALRGGVSAATHVDLWDTFSRNGTFLTGNGVNDDHGGQGWAQHANGFFTGIWAGSRADAALATALQAGRAFTAHVGRYPGAELDMLVDGAVPMGAVSVSSKTSRKLTIYAAHVPGGATVQLISGPVDYAGHADPGTAIDRSFPASAFVNGTVTVTVDTSTNRFYRIQVCHPAGRIIGIGNPVWLLRHAPPSGISDPRR